MDTRFSAADAEDMVFEKKPAFFEIGGRQIEIKPLNLNGLKVVLGFIKGSLEPVFNEYQAYRKKLGQYQLAKIAYDKAIADGDTSAVEPDVPNPLYWFGLIDERLDDLMAVITTVLQRGDSTTSLQFVVENIEPLKDIPALLPLIFEQNQIDKFLKNLITNPALLAMVERVGNSQIASTSPISQSISPGTTESTFTTSPEEKVDTPLPSASSSTTESSLTHEL